MKTRVRAIEERLGELYGATCLLCGGTHVAYVGDGECEVCACAPCGCEGVLRALGWREGESALRVLREIERDPEAWSLAISPEHPLRPYQVETAGAILGSIERGGGDLLAVVFSRQAGKDEMLAQLLAMLLWKYRWRGGEVVVVQPTMQPQGMISRRRLLDRLPGALVRGLLRVEENRVAVGKASVTFLSASPEANARGNTASLLLVANEAQDISADRWDAVFDPMAASTNATTVFMGTVWTSRTLLARQMRYLRQLELEDGRRRVFMVPWQEVARYVPAYGERVQARIAQLGRHHPFVRTEYFLEELADDGGFFPPAVTERMRGDHSRQLMPTPGRTYAALLDVGGEDLAAGPSSRRDSTVLTIVEVCHPEGADLQPVYRVMTRYMWTGVGQPELLPQVVHLVRDVWACRRVVVDATGLGAGLASALRRILPPRCVIPFVFTAASKSALGWDFLSLCAAGRFLDHANDGSREQALFWTQVAECEYEPLPGTGQQIRWGVSGATHDDLLMSAALVARLDAEDLRPRVARGHPRAE